MCIRKPCLKPLTYSTLGTGLTLPPARDWLPIRVADKPKRLRRLTNLFVNDIGFPDKSEYYKHLLQNIDGRPTLRKLKHPPLSLDEVDPKFFCAYDESKHGAQLKKWSQLVPSGTCRTQSNLRNHQKVLVCLWWQGCLCPSQELWMPHWYWGHKAHHHQKYTLWAQGDPYHADCHCCPWESWPHMTNSWWMLVIQSVASSQTPSRACAWHQQVCLVLLYQLYPAKLCDQDNCLPYSTLWFGNQWRVWPGYYIWLWDSPMGYHQLAVALASQEKLAFQGPDAIKWTHIVMPFGPTNGPTLFITFIHTVDSQWKALA